jgi:hypothetical protein
MMVYVHVYTLHCLQMENPVSRKCLDTMGGREGTTVGLYLCHGQAGNQVTCMM